MALQKQPVNINFLGAMDTKTDPYQVSVGKFLSLTNMVRDTTGRLTKRNGFADITTLPNTVQTTLTTLNSNLLATGSNLYAFNSSTNTWYNQGTIQPVSLSVQPIVRTTTSQTAPDLAITDSGLACVVYVDAGHAYYKIYDNVTGQQIVARQPLPATATNPRVTLLKNYFVISYICTNAGVPDLVVQAISIQNPTVLGSIISISSQIASLTEAYNVAIAFDVLYFAWNANDGSIKLKYMDSSFAPSTPSTLVGQQATFITLTKDILLPSIWVSWYDGSSDIQSASFTILLNAPVLAPTVIATGVAAIAAITSLPLSNVNTVFYEVVNDYNSVGAYPVANIRTDYISKASVTILGAVTAASVVLRSVGLASKAFLGPNNIIYMLVAYGPTTSPTNSNEPSYFLIDSSGNIYMRLAYSNGGGYASSQVLPEVSIFNGNYVIPYLYRDFLATVNKGTNNLPGTPSNAIYTQTGVNVATIGINNTAQYTSEIANTLHLTGGQLWMYDTIKPVEHGFQVWPENIQGVFSATGGSQVAQPSGFVGGVPPYFYVFTYEWTDGQGNLHRSAPSIPLSVMTTGALTTGSTTLYVPTLRLTYKTGVNPVRIVGYRWSVAQQVYYQFTSITSPVLNDTTIDYVTIVDTHSDAQILGQTILYTTGGVIEDIAAPASIASALFKNRLFLIDAEDRNLLWFSKQVIEATPVEMSDLLTIYVAPTSGAQGSTGPMTALGAMDDKLIVFKRDAIYYITGTGPDNTGASNDFSDPVFITSAIGCSNPSSIVLMPNGLMFQSDKGIWLLGRDLNTTYIGADMEAYNKEVVESATAIPGTNQVRFVLGNNTTLVYDYYFGQWATFSNIRAISATLYQNQHTYLNSLGQVFQETPNTYIDGSNPVLISLVTSWINVAGLQGYERFYQMLLLGTYQTPFKLNTQLAYNYNPSPIQASLILPDNFTPDWGNEAMWGSGGPWGGVGNVFRARVFPQQQKCESFQIQINEVYDPSFLAPAGQGLSLSGINLLVGVKKGTRTSKASQSFG